VLGAVNASALRADRERECARLRALTAPPRSAVLGNYVMAEVWLSLTPDLCRAYPAGISLVSTMTPPPHCPMRSALRRHPRIPIAAHILTNQHAARMFDLGPTSDQPQSCSDNARRIDPR